MGQPKAVPVGAMTSTVPEDEWAVFMGEFTRDNRGAHGEIEIYGSEGVSRVVEVEDRLFDGIAADVKDGENTIWILFGSDPDDRLTHGVKNVTKVSVKQPSGLQGAVLEIEAKGGIRTLLELSPAEEFALPPAGKS